MIEKTIHKYFLFKHPFFRTSADDKLKWLPFAAVFLLKVFKANTRSGWKKQVLVAGAAEGIKYLISDSLKKITHEHRPAPYMGSNHSFPSGHACTSFSTAEFMRTEIKNNSPRLAYAGYVAASAVAVIRIMKNKHWVRDVVAGAAIGIISTKLAYLLINKLERAKSKIKDTNKDDIEATSLPKLKTANEKFASQ